MRSRTTTFPCTRSRCTVAVMSADAGPTRVPDAARATQATFELDRFVWASPDRLEVAGRFDGLAAAPHEPAVLVVEGAGGVHRLPAVAEDSSGPPRPGEPWHAVFAWDEAPEPFTTAQLELGELGIALPEPGSKRPRFRHEVLSVRRTPSPARDVGLEAELLMLREQLSELQETGARDREELERAQQALQAERELRAADAERFRAGLEQLRASAERAVAEAAADRDEIRARLQTVRDALGGAL